MPCLQFVMVQKMQYRISFLCMISIPPCGGRYSLRRNPYLDMHSLRQVFFSFSCVFTYINIDQNINWVKDKRYLGHFDVF